MSDLPSDVNEHPYVAPPVVIEESMIWVTFRREGIHKYPAALEEEKLADVSFLGYPHRHMFHFKVWIQVRHNDREIEFIQFNIIFILFNQVNESGSGINIIRCSNRNEYFNLLNIFINYIHEFWLLSKPHNVHPNHS